MVSSVASEAKSEPAKTRRTLLQRLRPLVLRTYLPSPSRYSLGMFRSLAMRPWAFEFWYRARALRLTLSGRGLRAFRVEDSKPTEFVGRVSDYNRSQMWEFYRDRTEKLMIVLRALDDVPKDGRVLVIGPRNEAELLLLSLYGFKLKNITSVDLFSYSPKIQLADMHDLPFPDASFDVVYSAWTLKYSYDINKACSEIVRVVRPGGYVVTGFSHTLKTSEVVGSPIKGGLDELRRLFEPHVETVSFQEASEEEPGTWRVSLIFKARKGASLPRGAAPEPARA